MHKALDKDAEVYVAIKIVLNEENDEGLLSESEMLMKCHSPFIVGYNGMIQNGKELWVWFGGSS